ncbi:MAG: YmfQ family protein [Polaromonas sp.]
MNLANWLEALQSLTSALDKRGTFDVPADNERTTPFGVTLGAWLATLQALLPPGEGLTREPGSVFTRVLQALAGMLISAQSRLEDLLIQCDPRRATTMITDWEALLGLPDGCTPKGQQLPDRRRSAYQRLVELGGQSRLYFIGLAELLGEPGVTITEFPRFVCTGHCNTPLSGSADQFYWRVNIPRPAADVRFLTCNSACSTALQDYAPSPIECAFEARKPAHTNVTFAYSI